MLRIMRGFGVSDGSFNWPMERIDKVFWMGYGGDGKRVGILSRITRRF